MLKRNKLWKPAAWLLVFFVGLIGILWLKSDPIHRLVFNYSQSMGGWRNGIFSPVELPKDAPREKVVKTVLEANGFKPAQVASRQILKMRQIHIPLSFLDQGDGLFAALVQMGPDQKIVLFRWEEKIGWWNRVCDAKTLN